MASKKKIPDHFVWNIGVMMYYFDLQPLIFTNALPVVTGSVLALSDTGSVSALSDFNKIQGGNEPKPAFREFIAALEYDSFNPDDKKKFDKLTAFAGKDRVEIAYKKLFNCEGLSNYSEMLLELIKLAFSKHKEEQFNVKKNQEYVPIIEAFFSSASTTADKSSVSDTFEEGRQLSKAYFNSISDKGRFKSYINTESERIVIKNKLKTSKNSREYELSELVFNSPENKDIDVDCSLCLHGIGGTGKTFQLLSLYDLILKSKSAPYNSKIPFYLELNDIRTNTNNCVLFELAKRLKVEMDILADILKSQGSNVILMLDGYNEVTDGSLREEIAKRICDIRRDYKTRIIITSRLDHSDMFNRINRGETAVFTQAEIQSLSSSQINKYFKKIGVRNKFYNKLNKSVQRLVQTAQGLSMYGALLKKNSKRKIQNLGMLLREYVNAILLEDANDTSFEIYLEEIAYYMNLKGWFEISPEDLKEFFNQERLKKKYGEIEAEFITNNENIKKIFLEDSKGNFEFVHQHFKDMYCAQHFNRLISDIKNNYDDFKTNNVTTNDEVLVLCGNLIKNDAVIQKAIDRFKDDSESNYSFILSVLIKIFAFRNENDIHKLNLEKLDLSKVSLSGYTLYNKEYPKDEEKEKMSITTSHIQLNGATVSEDTFESNGLKRGSSTIDKYTKDGTEYIAAFCSDNLIIYDTRTTEWHSIRYHFKDNDKKFGWINCACHIEEEKIIVLGTDNGYITFFSYKDEPYINTDSEKFFKYNNDCEHADIKNGRSIESIVRLKNTDSSENILVASNSSGAVFVLDSDEIIKNPNNEEILEVRKNFNAEFNEEKFSTCKLTANSKYCFYSWGNKIFRSELSANCKEFKEWKLLEQNCIFDIYCTDEYLFVNTGKEILGISFDDNEIFDSYSYSKKTNSSEQVNLTRQDRIDRFTKISNFENCSDKVVVGTSAEDQDRNTIPNYIILTVEIGEDENGEDEYFINHYPIFGIEQTMTTFSAVSFKQDNHTFIATTSNDRSVQIVSVDVEDFKAIKHPGTYDGVHHIETISQEELLLAQYDGSVSHWKFSKKSKEWHCLNVYPIHKDWVWKTRYYKDKNNSYFFSCSYDGTVKRTNMKTYTTVNLIEDDDKIIDLALIKSNNNQLSSICAVTENKILNYDCENNEIEEPICFKDSDGLCERYIGDAKYAIKSVCPAIGKEKGTFFVAVNFYANNNKELKDIAKIYSVSSNGCHLVKSINQDNASEFENYIKIDEMKTTEDFLVITGQQQELNEKKERTTVYTTADNRQLDFEKIKSLSDLKERRIICLTMHDKKVFIGCLDGSVFTFNYDDILEGNSLSDLTPAFLTHANLISIYSIDMKNVLWTDDQQKDRFKGCFKNL